ncbi:hypothetical protein [Ferrimonas sediminum]|nr:hypothetical protein [Ferrimonas sediminum]
MAAVQPQVVVDAIAIASAYLKEGAQVFIHGRDQQPSQLVARLTKGQDVTVNSVLPGPIRIEGVENYFDTLPATEGKPVAELTGNHFSDHESTSSRAMNGQALRVGGCIIRAP